MTKINAPKYAFYYLLSLVALIFSALSVGMIVFQFINKNMPDIFGKFGVDFSPDVLKFAISAIIIAAPIFFWMSKLIYKNLAKGNLDKDAGVRRWLTYFILFVSAVVIISFLIATINSFLNGDWTTKFLLKMLTVVLIAAIVFSFYLYDIRRIVVIKKTDRVLKIYFWGALAIMIAAFVCALFIVESPATARGRLVDERIVNNFYSLQSSVTNYYSYHKKLPATLNDLRVDNPTSEMYLDPATNQEFAYILVSDTSYQLCATFRSDNKSQKDIYTQYVEERMRHGSGYQCLDFKIYPENIQVVPAGKQL
jgi:hypothetical protein